MRIVLTNDDGIDAPGIAALYDVIKDMGEVHVVAPATVQSAQSHAVTFHKPVRVERRPAFDGYAVFGRPADCVKLAVGQLIEPPIDLVISGMNSGANVGINVIYSGTVAAAREASFIGIPALAVSLHIGDWDRIKWSLAAKYARQAMDHALTLPRDPHTVININVPILDDRDAPEGVRILPLSTSPLRDSYEKIDNGDGSFSYRINESMAFLESQPGTDVHAIYEGYTTITPLHFDMTHGPQMQQFELHQK